MKNFIYTSLLIIILLFSPYGKSYSSDSAFEGRHFFVGFMTNDHPTSKLHLSLKIFIATSKPSTVSINIPNEPIQYHSLAANSVFDVDIPGIFQVDSSELIVNKGIEVISDQPIAVYAYSTREYTSDTYSVVPISYWGEEYVAMSWPNDQYIDFNGNYGETIRNSEFMIVGAFDSTVIKFKPRTFTKKEKNPYEEYSVVINKGECYQVQSLDLPIGQGDLTGTIVRGNKPFGMLSGHMRTAIPQFKPNGEDSKDHLCEMLLPTKAWGRFYVSTPFLKTGRFENTVYDPINDFFKVTCIRENTILTLETATRKKDFYMSVPGDFVTIPFIHEPAVWTSNKPIQIAQFMARDTSYINNHEYYDPSMVMLPPIDQLVNNINFLTPRGIDYWEENQYVSHNIMILAHKDALPTLEYNGVSLINFTDIAKNRILDTQFFWEILFVQDGIHNLKSDDSGFFGILYGFGIRDSYSMVMGASLTNPFEQDTIPPEITTIEDCGRIESRIFEIDHELNSGIDYVHVLEDSTFNYDWEIEKIDFNSMSVTIKAWPIDIFQDGRIKFDFRDRNGNGSQYDYFYNGLKATIPTDLIFNNIKFEDSTCVEFYINNDSEIELLVKSITISGDPRVEIYPDSTLPTKIAPLESMRVIACFDPDGDSTQLNAFIFIGLDCEYTHVININGSVYAPILEVDSLYFGNVMVGETKCLDMTISNKGNVPIRIDSLKVPLYDDVFVLDTVGMFPQVITAGDILKVPVCFTPQARKRYDSYCVIFNHYFIQAASNFHGRGVAPELENMIIDWGNRRVGTTNDTTLTLTNEGDTTGIITFTQFLVKNYDDRSSGVLENLNLSIEPLAGENFDLYFDPIDTDDYNLKAEYVLNWKLHPNFTIESIGKGTIPTIEVFDHRFDTIPVLSSIIESPVLIKSGGNEALTIDRLYPKSGDITSFNIDYSNYDNIMIQPDSSLSIPIEFKPNRSGDFAMTIVVVSDAMPNYERIEHEILIEAFAKEFDADNIDILVTLNEELFSCDTNALNIEYTNLGTTDISLDSVEIFTGLYFYKQDWVLPKVLTPGLNHNLDVVFIADKNEDVTFDFRSDFTILGLDEPENITKLKKVNFPKKTETILFTEPDIPEHSPGDELTVSLSGFIPRKNEEIVSFNVEITYDKFIYELLDNETDVIFFNGLQNFTKHILLDDNNGIIKINIDPDEDLMFKQISEWSFEIDFLVLLHDTLKSEFGVKIESEPCFDENISIIPTILTGICTFNLRSVELITNLTWINIIPNPVEDELKILVNIPEKDVVNISISDVRGKIIPLKRNLYLNKGIHSVIFEIGQIPNGIYNLVISGRQRAKKIFIIYK